MTAMLSIQNLRRTFAEHTAVADFGLEIAQGEFVTLLGPSGSGKSTVLRMIAGLLEPSSGEIRIDGKDVTHLPAKDRNIGFVFQSYALFPHLTAFENVAFPLRVRKWSKRDVVQRVNELLELVGLQHRAQYHPGLLSGGERQRIALARALAFHPPLLLLDEPLSALDAKVRVSLREFLKEIQRTTGVTTLMVTHDQEEALTLADRIVVMNAGAVEQVGTPYEVYHDPATSFTARFIGNVTPVEAKVERVQTWSSKESGQAGFQADAVSSGLGQALYQATLSWAGGQFDWLFKDQPQQGETKTVFVRPEAVEVSLTKIAGGCPAQAVATAFMGALSRLTLTVGEVTLIADVHSHQMLGIAPGTEVFVRIVDRRIS